MMSTLTGYRMHTAATVLIVGLALAAVAQWSTPPTGSGTTGWYTPPESTSNSAAGVTITNGYHGGNSGTGAVTKVGRLLRITMPAAGAGDLLAANNLSDLANAATARTNLGLGTAATQASTAFDAAGSVSAHNGSNTSHSALFAAARTNATHINGVAVATVTAGAAAGVTALQPTGNAAGLTNFPALVVQTNATDVTFANWRFYTGAFHAAIRAMRSGNSRIEDYNGRAVMSFTEEGERFLYSSNVAGIVVASYNDVLRAYDANGTNGVPVQETLTNHTAQIAAKVPTTRKIAINGVTNDLSADMSFTVSGSSDGGATNLVPGASDAYNPTTRTLTRSTNEPIAAAHIADTTAAHPASAISCTGTYSTVQAAINAMGTGSGVTNNAGTAITLANTNRITAIETSVPTEGAAYRFVYDSYRTPYTLTTAGTVTVTRAMGRIGYLKLAGNVTKFTFNTSDFPTNCVGEFTLDLVATSYSFGFDTTVITNSTLLDISTTKTTPLFFRKPFNGAVWRVGQ
jgi:hypothetical protein